MANFIVVFSPSVLSLESFLACVGKCAVSATSEMSHFAPTEHVEHASTFHVDSWIVDTYAGASKSR